MRRTSLLALCGYTAGEERQAKGYGTISGLPGPLAGFADGVWLAMAVDLVIRGFLCFVWVHRLNWAQRRSANSPRWMLADEHLEERDLPQCGRSRSLSETVSWYHTAKFLYVPVTDSLLRLL